LSIKNKNCSAVKRKNLEKASLFDLLVRPHKKKKKKEIERTNSSFLAFYRLAGLPVHTRVRQ